MTPRKEHTSRIAVTDEQGIPRTVDEFTLKTLYDPQNAGEKPAWINGVRNFKLGQHPVNVVDAQTFVVVTTGEILTRA